MNGIWFGLGFILFFGLGAGLTAIYMDGLIHDRADEKCSIKDGCNIYKCYSKELSQESERLDYMIEYNNCIIEDK